MKNNRRIFVSVVWIVLGIGLTVASIVAELNSFWSGLGTAFVFVGILQLVRWIKYFNDAEYREKIDVESKDERNRYIAARAWGWAGYIYVIISAFACVALRIMEQDLLSSAASGSVCLIMLLYWASYLVLKRKY